MIKSDVAAVVIGEPVYEALLDRKEECLEMADMEGIDHEAVKHRLEEMLDAARENGMSEQGLKRARKLIFGKARNVWRMKL